MKFSCSVTIDQPRDKVVELFDNPNNLKHWQDGFVSYKQLSGKPGRPGAKTMFVYKSGGRTIELTETILTNDLPNELSGRYEAREMTNTMKNTFTATGTGQTRWDADIEYLNFNGIIPKLLAFLMPGMFKKQTQKWLDQFKVFAEDGSADDTDPADYRGFFY